MTERERREQHEVLERLRRDGAYIARCFGLPLRSIDAERPQVKRRYGICFEDGSIRIRLRHVKTRRLLRYSALVDTLCHELAHLRHFNHGPRFHAFYRTLLAWARVHGIYRPRARATAARLEAPLRRASLGDVLETVGTRPALRTREPTSLYLFETGPQRARPSPRRSSAARTLVRERIVQLDLFGMSEGRERRRWRS